MSFRASLPLILMIQACAPTASPLAPPSALAGEFVSTHFTFHYAAIDAATIEATAASMEREQGGILADLGAASMPSVHVTFYLDHAALETATIAVAGVVPSWTFGLVTGEDHIHTMSPNLPAWGPYDRRMSDLVHEFAHCVTLHLNPRFANRPRWLWESVAIYESGQFVDPRALSYMTSHQPPTVSQLNTLADTRIYEVGYTIAEFIVSRWGHAALGSLVASHGDLAPLGLDSEAFFDRWFNFVQVKYGV